MGVDTKLPAAPGDAAVLLSSLVHLATAHPALLLEHVQAHTALLALELTSGAARTKRQALWWAAAFSAGIVAATLTGVASLLWLMRPLAGIPVPEAMVTVWGAASHWLLVGIPAVPLLLAGVCVAGGLGLFAARLPEHPGLLLRLQNDLAGLKGTPQ